MGDAALVVLFGAELDEVEPARVGGIRVAGGTKVSARDLVTMLLALAVTEMLARGEATLAEEEVKGRLRTRRSLMLRSSGTSLGFSALVATAALGGVEVRDLAVRILGRTVTSPEVALVALAHKALEGTGAMRPGSGGKLGAVLGMSSFEIDDDGAKGLRPEWERVAAAWRDWRASEPALATGLLDACRDSLKRARSGD